MGRYAYRCMKCRTRNAFHKKVEWYVRPRKCKKCGHWRFYWDKERNRRRDVCYCAGTYYPHRPGSSVCFDNPEYGKNAKYDPPHYRTLEAA